jgi:hypothetical protein
MDTVSGVSERDRNTDYGPGYYVHSNSWPAEMSGATMTVDEIYAAVDSMAEHYEAARGTLTRVSQ